MIKKLLILNAVIALVAVPVSSHAATLRAGHDYTLRKGASIAEDVYVASGNVSVAGDVQGDVVVAGGMINIPGTVDQDVLAAGGTLNILGTVHDDVRALGGNITLGGRVGDSVLIAGGQVQAISDSVIGGDVVIAGGHVVLDGQIDGDLTIVAGSVKINGIVNGSVHARSDAVEIGESAVIRGDVDYKARESAQIAPGAQILGKVTYHQIAKIQPDGRAIGAVIAGFLGLWLIVKFLMLVTSALVVVLVFRRLATHAVDKALTTIGHTILIGLLFLIGAPIVIMIVGMTVLGAPLAVIAGLGYIASLLVAKILSGIILGAWLIKRFTKHPVHEVSWRSALLGIVVISIVGLIPFIGLIVKSLIFLLTLGVLPQMWKEMVWDKR